MKRAFQYLAVLTAVAVFGQEPVRFAILGDRTGETQGDVYQRIWKEVKSERPDLVLSVGDTIQGLGDASAERQWREAETIVGPLWWGRLYLAPGNHDIWSNASEALFERHSGHPHHYSFDHGPVHVTVLDNSRADQFAEAELDFLEKDLAAHRDRPVKFIVSHRPSWLLSAVLKNPDFRLHRLAKRYGVGYVIAGHVHQMIHAELEGIEYISMPSSGGHLRGSARYEDGWFFGHGVVTVRDSKVQFELREVSDGRVTELSDWGVAGLRHVHAVQ